jgi:excisionase family DNA binding protein
MKNIVLCTFSLNEFRECVTSIIREELEELIPKQIPYEDYLTRAEAAELLKISLPTLSKWSQKGILTSHRIHNTIRYRRSEIESAFNEIRDAKYRREVIS